MRLASEAEEIMKDTEDAKNKATQIRDGARAIYGTAFEPEPALRTGAAQAIQAAFDTFNSRLRALLLEREHIAAVLHTFHTSTLSMSSVGPVLELAEDLNPTLLRKADR